MDWQALIFSSHVRGRTPLTARSTHTTFTSSSSAAACTWPLPSSTPAPAVYGSRATATISPTSTADSPVVRDSTATAPEAGAKATPSMPTSVRAASSWLCSSSGTGHR